MVNKHRMTEEFLEMVKVDSVSGKEREMAGLLKKKLVNLGLEVFEDDAGSKINTGTGNVIARLGGKNPAGPPLMICAHMDTVEPGRGVRPVIEEGVVRSSGDTVLGGDDKAGIAIILEALRVIGEAGISHGGLEVVFTVFEEGGLLGAKNLGFSLLKSEMGYVLDSDGRPGTIVTSAPTQDRISATITGRSAHAGICPEKGINAIEVAAKAISGMNLGRIDSETTANIGVISGGKATNIVPDTVNIQGETRSLNQAKKDEQTRLISEKLEETAGIYGAKADVRVENLYREFSINHNHRVVRMAVEAAENLGLSPSLETTGGGSDANIFNENGIATAILGIAMQNVHTTEEFIRIDDMAQACRYLVEIIRLSGLKILKSDC